MLAACSPIKLVNFAVLQSQFRFIQPKRQIKDPSKLFDLYEIDIDFAHQQNDDSIQVFVKIEVNQGNKPSPGYQVLVEGAAVFKLTTPTSLSEKEIGNLKFFSTVNILIGYLRNTIATLTASAPLGTYLLPTIDVTDLFNKKKEAAN
jgi:preprotein translocase subunit SecB